VIALDPLGTGAAAGVKVGDYLVSIGGLDANDPSFGTEFSSKFAGLPPNGSIALVVRRAGQQMTLNAAAKFRTSERRRIIAATDASPKALRVREGLLTGTTRP
jgi:predicted metalloprotease with PDZ domain